MKEYLILPGCDDTNRGDQALIWETAELAREAGYKGVFYMLADSEKSRQSLKKGIRQMDYILPHPADHFSEKNNITYTKMLKLKWALAAAADLVKYLPLLSPFLRKLLYPLYGKKTKRALKHYKRASAAFVKGGGFLHAYGGLTETYKIFYFLYHIMLAQSFGKDVFVMPNSFGPFHAPLVKKMLQKTLSKCKVVMTRESISEKALRKECGISPFPSTDLAFFLKADESFLAEEMLRKKGIPVGNGKCVALTMRVYRFPGCDQPEKKYRKYVSALSGFIIWLSENGYHPVLTEHVSCELAHENDMTCIREVERKIAGKCRYSVFSAPELTCEQMKRIYRCFDYMIGTRFHSVIFSVAEGVPAIALTYGGNKGTGIMRDLGMEEYSVPMEDISLKRLKKMFLSLVQNREKAEENICVFRKSMEKKKENIIKAIRKDV